MKHLFYALLLLTLFAASCSGSEDQQTNTTKEAANLVENNSTEPATTESNNGAIAENLDNQTIEDVVATENTGNEETAEENTTPNITTRSSNTKKDAPVETTTTTSSKPTTTTTSTTDKKAQPKLDDLLNDGKVYGNSREDKEVPKDGGVSSTTTSSKPAKPTLSHDGFDELLRKYVSSSGGVDYDGFKRNKKLLDQYLELLKNNPPSSSWSKNKEMAYWINMYNAFTIQAIVEKYPINSITDLEGGKVWDKRKIVVAGKSLTLNNIEKDKLLKRFKEPRVHFAVNCAAKSCPPLLNKAWTEDNVQRYLGKQAKAFINNAKENTLSAKKIQVSQIFNWYAGDFGGSDKVVAYFQKYSDTEIKSNAKVEFKEYNWSLNKK